jgi:hypothetical protein
MIRHLDALLIACVGPFALACWIAVNAAGKCS